MTSKTHETSTLFDFDSGYMTSSTMMPHGGWCHVIAVRHVWNMGDGPNTEVHHAATVLDDTAPTIEHMTKLIDNLGWPWPLNSPWQH